MREIIQLGEVGGDLILKKLGDINDQKEKFSKPASIAIEKIITERKKSELYQEDKPFEKKIETFKEEKSIEKSIETLKEEKWTTKELPEEVKKSARSLDDVIKKEDTIIDKFKKMNELKKKFFKPETLKMQVEDLFFKVPPGITPPKEGEKPSEEKKKEEEKYITKTKQASEGLNKLARSAASFDPTQFTIGVLDSINSVTKEAAGAIPVIGNILSGMSEYTKSMLQTGALMGSNALNAIKSAQNSAIDTMERRGRIQYYGGSNVIGKQYSIQEQSGIVEEIANRFGRFQGTKLAETVNKLFKQAPDLQQATAIASGNYRALGTDKGYFLQQISDSLGNLPPSISQEVQNQLLQQFVTPEGKKELNKDYAIKNREMRAALMTQDQNTQITIAGMGRNAKKLNNTLNELSINLVRNGANLTGALDKMAGTINTIIMKVSEANKAK